MDNPEGGFGGFDVLPMASCRWFIYDHRDQQGEAEPETALAGLNPELGLEKCQV